MSREETAYIEKLVAINRVAKVVKGGKRFSFAALVVVGDGKGRVGFASGKAKEVTDAVKKASEKAKKSMIRVPMREGRSLHHDAFGKFGAGKVVLRSAPAGTGIIAGGAMRSVFEALGIQDVVSKCLGSANPFNMVRATFDALMSTVSPRYIASKRGKKIGEITSRRTTAAKAAAK
jgi:small subunit ribosomal protein S5